MTIICSVARSGKRPILFLPRHKNGEYGFGLPKGDVAIVANGRPLTASIAKIACNVVRDDDGKNVLPEILFGWFGQDAGAAGTPKMRVQFRLATERWILEPITPACVVAGAA